MARKPTSRKSAAAQRASAATARTPGRSSSLIDTRVIYCGDCLEQLRNLPDGGIDLIYIDYMRRLSTDSAMSTYPAFAVIME